MATTYTYRDKEEGLCVHVKWFSAVRKDIFLPFVTTGRDSEDSVLRG